MHIPGLSLENLIFNRVNAITIPCKHELANY